jgi:hypothetical protein
MALKLSYCQLIKIVLSQIGGSPLQQVYTQLSQGLQQITKGGIIPSEYAQLKTFIDQVTTAVNNAGDTVNGMQKITNEFFQNPVKTVSNESIALIDTRLATIGNPSDPEYIKLLSLKSDLESFVTHTDTLIGAGADINPTGGFGGCTLADLLGNGCSPAADVPDVDLQVLVDGFKSGAVLNQLKTNLTNLVATGTGYTQILASINSLQSSIQLFNTTVTSKLNKIIIKQAVETYVTNLAFSLLSGCSNQLVNATIKPSAATALAPFVEYQQKIRDGLINADGTSTTTTTLNT